MLCEYGCNKESNFTLKMEDNAVHQDHQDAMFKKRLIVLH